MQQLVTAPYPVASAIDALVTQGAERVRQASANGLDVVERHNAFVDYCLALLFAGTGHRPVQDPFESLEQFDLEHLLLLVSDKVSDENRAWHLVALPTLAGDQFSAYMSHLSNLAPYISRTSNGQRLASDVYHLAQQGSSPLPLFFYLRDRQGRLDWERVRPAALEKQWNEYWSFPVAILRHVHATELTRVCECAEWARIQLGHERGVDHPFGVTSPHSPLEYLGAIREALDEVIARMGWTLLKPPLRRPPASTFRPLNPESDDSLLGHDRRALDRQKRRTPAQKLLRDAFGETQETKPLRDFNASDYEKLIFKLVDRAAHEGLSPNYALRVIYRLIQRQPGGKKLLQQVARIRQIEPEPSPFSASTLSLYCQLRASRAAFLRHLDEQGRKGLAPDRATRHAEILISAALFSGLASFGRLRSLGENLSTCTFSLAGQIFVDIPLTVEVDTPVYRWFPDALSAQLLLGCPGGAPETIPTLSSVFSRAARIIKELGGSNVTSLRDIVSLADAGLRIEAPGYIRATLTGNVPAISLPLPTFVRVVAGLPLMDTSDEPPPQPVTHDSTWTPDLGRARTSPKRDEAEEFLRLFKRKVSGCRPKAPRGHVYPSQKSKRCLADALAAEFGYPQSWSMTALLLASWAVHLCQKGTRFKKRIQFTTVTRYVLMVARPLMRQVKGANFLDLNDAAYEGLYIEALDWVPASQRARLAGRLQEFHQYLVDEFSIDEPDWTAILKEAGSDPKGGYADANLITESEYLRALSCVSGDPRLSHREQLQFGSLLFFGYRYGLRFGESWRLLYRNLHADIGLGNLTLDITDSIYGELKTFAARRFAHALEPFTEREHELIDALLEHGELEMQGDHLAPIMAEESSARVLRDRTEAVRHLHHVLRHVTGDSSVRYHHFRHGWVTRMMTAQHQFYGASGCMYLPMGPSGLNPWEWREFYGEDWYAHPLRAIATSIGHAHETTTLGTYTHSADLIASDTMQRVLGTTTASVSDHAVAYALQVAPATIRRRRSRGYDALNPKRTNRSATGIIAEPRVRTNDSCMDPQCPPALAHADRRFMTLPDVDLVLRRYAGGARSPEVIARQHLLEQPDVERVLDVAAQVERESGYDRYRVEWGSDDPLLSMASANSSRIIQFAFAETARLREVLRNLESQIAETESTEWSSIESGVKVWATAYDPRSEDLQVSDLCDLQLLESVVRMLGAELELMLGEDRAARMESWLSSESRLYAISSSRGLRPLGEKSPLRRQSTVSARIRLSSELVTKKTVHRACYLMATWSRFLGLTRSGIV